MKEDEDKRCMTCKRFYHMFDDWGACLVSDGRNDKTMNRVDTKACSRYKPKGTTINVNITGSDRVQD